MSIVSLWLYCHRFGVNSHSVAVIATGYPVAIATAYYKTLIGVTSSKHSLCTFTMYQLQHSFTVAVIEHGHCSYDQFHKLYYLLLQCLPYTNAMQCCSFLCLYYNTSSPIFPLKQYSMHFTTGSCQAVANKGHAIASKITQKVHIFTHLN